ncbi:hypothetical protein DKT77_01290 [Meridianimarinicoccus roseus]|uniref:Tetratricopeptide repeat protein n=2 Tax=Meridianimarinicoccus roseus TaxID=2072018 RepID=A0A2V2LN41_9RHOB|nr:hypothetical protein DKT77_01290 [Meridianimarinicoccus roseus]
MYVLMEFFMLPRALILLLSTSLVTGSLGPASATSTDSGPGLSLGGGLQDLLGPGTDPLAGVAEINQAVTALELRLRDYGDLRSVLDLAPVLIAQVPDNGKLRRLHAAALAAEGDRRAARRELDASTGLGGLVWQNVAEALIARAAADLPAAQQALDAAILLEPDNAYARNVEGTIAAAAGDFVAAEIAFAAAADAAPDAPSYYGNLGAARLRLGALGPALSALDHAVSLAPADCGLRSTRALALQQQGRGAEAAVDLETCLSGGPTDPALVTRLVQAHLSGGQVDKAADVVAKYGQDLPNSASWQSEIALRRGDAKAAQDAAERIGGASAEAVSRLAYAALIGGDDAKALENARRAIALEDGPTSAEMRRLVLALSVGERSVALEPNGPAERFLAALGENAAGNSEAAMSHLSAAAEVIPGFTADGLSSQDLPSAIEEARDLAVAMNLVLRDLDGAAQDRLGRAASGSSALHLYVLGLAERGLGNTQSAQQAFSRAVDSAPRFRAARLELAEMAMTAGDGPTALEHYVEAGAVSPSPSIALRIGVISEALGDTAGARAAYEELLTLAPDNYLANNQLAWFLVANEGDLDRALELARHADTLQPGNASVVDTIGWIHFLNGDYARAADRLREAFEISRGATPEIRYHYARAELAIGNPDAAMELIAPIAGEGEDGSLSARAQALLDEAKAAR